MDKFDELAENEVLFEHWWNFLCYERDSFVEGSFMSVWAKAKDIAINVLGSKKALLTFRREIHLLRSYYDDTFCGFDVKSFNAALCCATTMIIISGKKDEVDGIWNEFEQVYNPQENIIAKYAVDLIYRIEAGEIKKDYDYSKVDGGIKDETETDETETDETKTDGTKTITITKTDETITEEDETITKTITKTESVDVILQNYNSLNNDDFISAMQKAIEKGLIEIIEKGKYKWVGFKEVKSNFNAALAYFIAKALKIKMELKPDKTLTTDSHKDINKKFPENYDIKEVFGVDIQSDQLVNALRAKNIQKWREVIDKFFDEET